MFKPEPVLKSGLFIHKMQVNSKFHKNPAEPAHSLNSFQKVVLIIIVSLMTRKK